LDNCEQSAAENQLPALPTNQTSFTNQKPALPKTSFTNQPNQL
jgi:hypothetical protein